MQQGYKKSYFRSSIELKIIKFLTQKEKKKQFCHYTILIDF